ncbi:hypothetical protein [Sphingomonas kyungheensis]|uniref:Uncharacterized protein n=1 Tax=Sphingomonas kyungheensis TaxID=1069987 RepID=A0ABU8H2M7_9SPHN
MDIEDEIDARFNAILERDGTADQELAQEALLELRDRFGEEAVRDCVRSGFLALGALVRLSHGDKRASILEDIAQPPAGRQFS